MYDVTRHEPLIEAEWNQELALAAIDRIVRDTHARFDRQKLWPIHPLDKITDEPTKPFRMLYFGAAGVIWALDHLRVVGATAMQRDFKDALIDLAAKNRAEMQLRAPHTYSYFMGDVGIQLVQWRISPSDALADQIFQAVEANMTNPARELMWGAPGTMLAALFMLESSRRLTLAGSLSAKRFTAAKRVGKKCGTQLPRLDPEPLWAVEHLSWSRSRFCRKRFFNHQGPQAS